MTETDALKAKNQEPAAAETDGGEGESSQVIKARFDKAAELADSGCRLYPNTYRPLHKTADLQKALADTTAEELEQRTDVYTLSGRIMARRDYGKSVFFDIEDPFGRIQAYIQKQRVTAEEFALFKKLDIGDIIGLSGRAFKTKTGELTILVEKFELVTKSLWPLPEKFHDMNVEMRYRQRYVDLIMNAESKKVFIIRSQVVAAIRAFMTRRGFLEVETPMMHPIPGGATARPFETFHNALDRKLYLRIAPELYLKRLLVGGFDRVFEINRSFRNEGISIQHNPEFTMMEFYQSYANFNDLMDLTEELFVEVAQTVLGRTEITYQGTPVNLNAPWKRISWHAALKEIAGCEDAVLNDREAALKALGKILGFVPKETEKEALGKIQARIFDELIEPKLVDPTFITHYPADISPLARRNDENPDITDRFELFITGREMANAFSELNDPLDQRERFMAQVAEREAGDQESMYMDEDYVRALMYGMPPAAGEGLGIDRLVMLLADVPSIKDVILFPHMRPER